MRPAALATGTWTPTASAATRLLERLQLTSAGAWTLAALGAGWLAARQVGARSLLLIVYTGALGAFLAWLVSRRRLAIDADRSAIPMRSSVGQTVSAELVLTSRRRASGLIVEEQLHPQLGKPMSVSLATLAPGEEMRHAYSFTPSMRGVYKVGPVVAHWSDPFGLTSHSQELAEAVDIIVHPDTERVLDRVLTRMWEDPPVRPPFSKPWPVGYEFYGMREYVPGDDLRRVVWSVLARTGKMMVRESEQGITDRVVIVLDNDADGHSPGDVSATFEAAVRTAASVGVRHLADGFAVSLFTSEGLVRGGLRGSTARLDYLDTLARVQRGSVPLETLGHRLTTESRNRAHFLVLTPHLTSQAAAQLRLVVERGVSVVIGKIMWEESDPLSLVRATALGCQVLQIPIGAPLEAVFANMVGAGRKT